MDLFQTLNLDYMQFSNYKAQIQFSIFFYLFSIIFTLLCIDIVTDCQLYLNKIWINYLFKINWYAPASYLSLLSVKQTFVVIVRSFFHYIIHKIQFVLLKNPFYYFTDFFIYFIIKLFSLLFFLSHNLLILYFSYDLIRL